MQVLAARRERSDKISKLMGDYMLKVNCVYPRRRSEFIFLRDIGCWQHFVLSVNVLSSKIVREQNIAWPVKR